MVRFAERVELNVIRILVTKPEGNYHLLVLGVGCILSAS